VQRLLKYIPDDDILFSPFVALGRSVRMMIDGFRQSSVARIDWTHFRELCNWLGPQSLPLVALSAIFVALALTFETVLEMRKYMAQDLSGAVITLGLLRELGPLTVSLAWAARFAARIAVEAHETIGELSDIDFAHTFLFPRWLAAFLMSGPVAAYGLVIGFVSAALFAPFLGVSSMSDFIAPARVTIDHTDLTVFFIKLILINTTIAVFAGCVAGRNPRVSSSFAVANAISILFIAGFIANWFCTWAIYQH